MAYNFYGWEGANISPIKEINKINNPRDLYDALSNIWCEYSCAPRLRVKWSKENKTVGQCSTTAFLVQDLFGGKVYGIKLDDERKEIIYYTIEQKKNEEKYTTLNCPKCGCLVDVLKNNSAHCDYCGSIVEDKH